MRIQAFQSAFHKALQYQTVFASNIAQFRSLSSLSPRMDPNIGKVIDFWFQEPLDMGRWFMKNDAFDAEIKTEFGELVQQARTIALDSWTDAPEGTLALLILLDQFPRNIFRGSPESYASDPKALDVATTALWKEFDKKLPAIQRPFIYLPLVHDEKLISHVAVRLLYREWASSCSEGAFESGFVKGSLSSLQAHTDVLLRFGRYPSRNEVLGRKSTPEEIEFVKENPAGFAKSS